MPLFDRRATAEDALRGHEATVRRFRQALVGHVFWASFFVLGASWLTAPAYAQATATQKVMREKLGLSQVLLAALVTSDWTLLNKNTQALLAVTKKPGWQVLQAPEYLRQTSEFFDAAQALGEAALQRDSGAAATAYTRLVASCVACHRYVALSRRVGQ